MVLEDVEDPSCDGLMGLKKISTTSVLETGKISPLTVPDGGVVLSRPRPTLVCSTHDDDDDIVKCKTIHKILPGSGTRTKKGLLVKLFLTKLGIQGNIN
jgi:hypothetical protein